MADAGGMGERRLMRSAGAPAAIERRQFLGVGLSLVLIATGRWASAQVPLRFRPLARPVVVPLEDLATPGRARPFVAEAVTLPTAATPDEPIRISGLIARVRTGEPSPELFQAVCARCPHEYCDVEVVTDPARVPAEVVAEIGRPVDRPVYMCPCHNSTFALDDGGRLAGPAPRGLYRFRVTRVADAVVEIGEVEEDVLIFV